MGGPSWGECLINRIFRFVFSKVRRSKKLLVPNFLRSMSVVWWFEFVECCKAISFRRTVVRRMRERSDLLPKLAEREQNLYICFWSALFRLRIFVVTEFFLRSMSVVWWFEFVECCKAISFRRTVVRRMRERGDLLAKLAEGEQSRFLVRSLFMSPVYSVPCWWWGMKIHLLLRLLSRFSLSHVGADE
jgi:hypothetical protein